jgi:hypothetical protein
VQGLPLRRPGLAALLRVDTFGGPEPRLGRGENHGQEIDRLHLLSDAAPLLRVGHFGGFAPEGVRFESGGGGALQQFPQS